MKICFSVRYGVVSDVFEWDELVMPRSLLTKAFFLGKGVWYGINNICENSVENSTEAMVVYYVDLDIVVAEYNPLFSGYLNDAIVMMRNRIIDNLF